MSHLMTALAMQQQGLKPATKIVLYWLADHHNSETGFCFPSLNTLAAECEMGRNTVVSHLEILEEMGLISRNKRVRPNGSQTSTEYVLSMKQPVQKSNSPCSKSAPPPVQNLHPHNLGKNNLGNKPLPPSGVWGERDENVLEMPKQRKKPRHSLPDDWVPDLEKAKALSDEYNLGRDEMNFCYQQMKGHAHATDRKLVNWDQGFANWIRKAVQSREVGPKSRKAGNQDFADRFKGI